MRRSRRFPGLALAVAVAASSAGPAVPVPGTTEVRTIQDTDRDNLLEFAPGERHVVLAGPPGFDPRPGGAIVNFLQLSDFQIVDEESPARVEFLDTTQRGPFDPFAAAHRPQESLTVQVAEAMIRAPRNTRSPFTHEPPALTILTGDNADSQQYNETRWFIDVLDGATFVNPDSGIPPTACPDPTPESRYDGVRAADQYYDPDASGEGTDGHGYSPDREENVAETGRDVTVRNFPGLFESANRPFRAVGVGMPWYSAFGNHDALVQGNSPHAHLGPFGAAGESWATPDNPLYHQIATGCVKPSNAAPGQILGDPALGGAAVPADPGDASWPRRPRWEDLPLPTPVPARAGSASTS